MYRPYPAAVVFLLLFTASRAFANHCSSHLAFVLQDCMLKDRNRMALPWERPSSPRLFRGQKRYPSSQMVKDAKEYGPPPATKRQRQSYLKVLLGKHKMTRFHNLALQVRDHLDKSSSSGDNEKTKSMSSSSSPSDNQDEIESRPRLRIKPRSLTSLHMTFFFGGVALCKVPAEALTEWHSGVSARLEESCLVSMESASTSTSASTSGVLTINTTPTTTTSLDEYWFRVVDIRTFPPRRNNLVVAVLEASPRWHELYADIRSLARASSSHTLRDVVRSSKDEWIPHVTLANIYGGSKLEYQQLNQLLKELSLLNLLNLHSSTAQATESTPVVVKASGIAMGGPIPAQAELDWNFDFVGLGKIHNTDRKAGRGSGRGGSRDKTGGRGRGEATSSLGRGGAGKFSNFVAREEYKKMTADQKTALFAIR
jgi:hypothetical protein